MKSLTIDRLKSFNHASLMFNQGFTCIVGPNGSGKSTICDALLFGLGEKSLKRLRAEKLDDLIRSSAKAKGEKVKKAYVRLEFTGDADISVTRFVRSDGKSKYVVNGKTMKRHEVLDLLARYGIKAEETNTIAQGEIGNLSQLNAVDLRELIDAASGIREFEYKKTEAMRELEKVDQKISESRALLGERSGFLSELSAEKEAAEKYVQLNSRIRSLTYSILVYKKEAAATAVSSFDKSLAGLEDSKNSIMQRLNKINAALEELNGERQKLTKQLSESTENIGSVNAELESTNIAIARLEAEIAAMSSSFSEGRSKLGSIETEQALKLASIESNKAKLSELKKRLPQIEEEARRVQAKAEKFDAKPELIKELGANVDALERELSSKSAESSKAGAELSIIKNMAESKLTELNSAKELLQKKSDEVLQLDKAYQEANKRRGEISEMCSGISSRISAINSRISALDDKLIELREKKAYVQPRTQALSDKLGSRFGKSNGFHGRVSDLCSYKPEHAYAIEAAAGARFEYFVVDTIDTADILISYMKDNSLGRATFIPIRELKQQSDTREKSLTHVLDLVDFDQQFNKVFSYVFNNTYVVGSINDAKRHGVGKRRYVTTDGDIIEQAGIVSGGSSAKKLSAASINAQIKESSDEKDRLKIEYETASAELNKARKEEAYADMDINSLKGKLNLSSVEAAAHKKSISEITKSLAEISLKESGLSKLLERIESDKSSIEDKLENAKKALDSAVNETVEMTKRMAESGISQEAIEKAESARKSLEALRINIAELNRENSLLESAAHELALQIKGTKSSLKDIESGMKKKHSEREQLAARRKEVELIISKTSGESKKIFERIGKLDSEIEKAGAEKGKFTAELSSNERQAGEINVRRAQLETTLNDLTAELAAYRENIELIKADAQAMEKESAALKSKVADLGNVNLRAPELYADKLKGVEEARSKVETLETERHAVMRMIEEIDSKKLQTFMSTFNDVVINFKKFSGYVLSGDSQISLTNPQEPFKSGLDISVVEGKTRKHLHKLSGGEKSLALLVLVFSIHMCRPAAIYVFDEVDNALDKNNSKKLSLLIKQMSSNAQFIVVSHNDSLITNADAAIGVVKTGEESKAVGLEMAGLSNKK